jgi:hypothetical protein
MNPRQAAFVMIECARFERENRDADGWYIPPTPEQYEDLARRAEAFEYPWVRLWHRIRLRALS